MYYICKNYRDKKYITLHRVSSPRKLSLVQASVRYVMGLYYFTKCLLRMAFNPLHQLGHLVHYARTHPLIIVHSKWGILSVQFSKGSLDWLRETWRRVLEPHSRIARELLGWIVLQYWISSFTIRFHWLVALETSTDFIAYNRLCFRNKILPSNIRSYNQIRTKRIDMFINPCSISV